MTARRRTRHTRLPRPLQGSPAGGARARPVPTAVVRPFALSLPLVLLLGLGACGFDSSALGGPGGEPDAGGGPAQADASPVLCPEELHTEFVVDGAGPTVDGAPLATVLLGDTVRLDAAGSCSRAGPVRYRWQIDDEALAATADPGLDYPSLTVYPVLPRDYQITLTVSDDVGDDEPVSVVGIRALGWTRRGQGLDVREVAAGNGRVWIASSEGPRTIDLEDPERLPRDLNLDAAGVDVPNDLGAVLQAPGSNFVWFTSQGEDGAVWRLTVSPPQIQRIALPAPLDDADVRDIAAQGAGVAVATDEGVAVAADNLTFGAPIPVGDVVAVTENPESGWAGREQLFRLSDQVQFSPFGGGNNRILALAGDDQRIWVGSDDRGIARFDTSSGKADLFTVEQGGLPSNRVRDLAVDSSHDVWAATQNGVARYKRDYAVWVSMGADAGLSGLTDLRAVTVLEVGAQRLIVVGANDGIAILGP